MQVSPDQGALLSLFVGLVGARNVVEVGTFTGYSALAMARALPPGGRLLCCDVSEEWTSIGQRYWEQAGVADRITLRIAPAIETLRALPADDPIDLGFIDADKTGYAAYYEELLGRLRQNGLILVDNTLWVAKWSRPPRPTIGTPPLCRRSTTWSPPTIGWRATSCPCPTG
jgi:caffeoyl-CoA O-methyltransferase